MMKYPVKRLGTERVHFSMGYLKYVVKRGSCKKDRKNWYQAISIATQKTKPIKVIIVVTLTCTYGNEFTCMSN